MGLFLWTSLSESNEWPEDWESTELSGRSRHEDADAFSAVPLRRYEDLLDENEELLDPSGDG